jgi:hypothetical protein
MPDGPPARPGDLFVKYQQQSPERSLEHAPQNDQKNDQQNSSKHDKQNSLKNETEMPTWPM